MTVKELIKKLETCDQNALVTTSDYFGCNHTMVEVKKIVRFNKNQHLNTHKRLPPVDDGGKLTDYNECFKRNVVYISHV
jgi:hypothetical protein